MEEDGIDCQDSQEVEIFFARDEWNHPESPDPRNEGPNWYYYSLQILPCVADVWFLVQTEIRSQHGPQCMIIPKVGYDSLQWLPEIHFTTSRTKTSTIPIS